MDAEQLEIGGFDPLATSSRVAERLTGLGFHLATNDVITVMGALASMTGRGLPPKDLDERARVIAQVANTTRRAPDVVAVIFDAVASDRGLRDDLDVEVEAIAERLIEDRLPVTRELVGRVVRSFYDLSRHSAEGDPMAMVWRIAADVKEDPPIVERILREVLDEM